MGLDLIELVMDVEDAFGIEIPDADATSLTTVGALILYVQSKTKSYSAGPCATSVAFHSIRRFLLGRLPLQRRDVRPEAKLETLIPESVRRDLWRELRQAYNRRPPRLGRPWWTGIILAELGLAACAALFFSLGVTAICIASLFVWYFATLPWATQFPTGWLTVRDLSYRLANPPSSGAPMSDAEIAHKVRLIISDQLAIPIDRLTDESSFFRT